jgi:hypothetical protein
MALLGTSVEVYGTIDIAGDPNNPNDPVSTYSIDGTTATRYVGERSQRIVQYRKLFFQSPKLEAGEHTLVITSTGDQGRLILDYVQFVPIPSKPFVHKDSPTNHDFGPSQ